MLPTKVLEAAIAAAIGADVTTLAEATPFVEVQLYKAAFTPGPDLVPGSVTEADFDGYGAKHAASAATQVFTDPATGEKLIQVREPAGGWHWETSGITHLPMTIYGYGLAKSDGSALYATATFDTPIVLNGSGQGIDVPQVRLRLPSGFMS